MYSCAPGSNFNLTVNRHRLSEQCYRYCPRVLTTAVKGYVAYRNDECRMIDELIKPDDTLEILYYLLTGLFKVADGDSARYAAVKLYAISKAFVSAYCRCC